MDPIFAVVAGDVNGRGKRKRITDWVLSAARIFADRAVTSRPFTAGELEFGLVAVRRIPLSQVPGILGDSNQPFDSRTYLAFILLGVEHARDVRKRGNVRVDERDVARLEFRAHGFANDDKAVPTFHVGKGSWPQHPIDRIARDDNLAFSALRGRMDWQVACASQ